MKKKESNVIYSTFRTRVVKILQNVYIDMHNKFFHLSTIYIFLPPDMILVYKND